MTFCTFCASAIGPNLRQCPACGTALLPPDPEVALTAANALPARHSGIMHLLRFAPAIVLIVVGTALLQRHQADAAWQAAAYAAAEQAEQSGDLVAARDQFAELGGYRDAEARLAAVADRLAPFEHRYDDGVRAMERGDFETAFALLDPVASQAPTLQDVVSRRDDARQLLSADLSRRVEGAEATHDWASAERTLRRIVALNPTDPAVRARLGTLQREHGPILFGHDRDIWLGSPDGSEMRQLTSSYQALWPVWNPDRSAIAFLASDDSDPTGNVSLYVVSLDGNTPRRIAEDISAHAPPAWSPDGTGIAYTSFAGYDPVHESGSISVRTVDVATGKETDLTGDRYTLAFNPAWSPDGKRLAFVVKYMSAGQQPQHAPGDVIVANNGSFENLTNGSTDEVWSVSWSPLGKELLLFSLYGQTWYEPPSTAIRLLDPDSGTTRLLVGEADHPATPVWSPDGTRFAYVADESNVVVSDVQGGQQTFDAQESLSGDLTWSPDGLELLAAPSEDGAASTILDLSRDQVAVSTAQIDFDTSPPYVAPPQWGPAIPLSPSENPALPLPASVPSGNA